MKHGKRAGGLGGPQAPCEMAASLYVAYYILAQNIVGALGEILDFTPFWNRDQKNWKCSEKSLKAN